MANIITAVMLILLTTSTSALAETFKLNTADKPPYSTQANDGYTDLLVQKAFASLGYRLIINHLPSARSIENAELGIDDGEYARIAGLSEKYPNLIMVDEPLFHMKFTAFSANPELSLASWQDLRNYRVGHIRGWVIFESNIPAGTDVSVVASDKELFALLLNDRVDLILYDELRGLNYLQSRGIETLYPAQAPLVTRGMHLYLNKKHKALLPEINRAITAAKN